MVSAPAFEKWNAQYRNHQWIDDAGASGDEAWTRLRAAVIDMLRPDDDIVLPDRRKPFAWRALWKIYKQLRAREDAPTDSAVLAEEAADKAFAADVNEAWAQYLVDHADIVERRRLGEFGADELEYIGLKTDDFLPPMSNAADAVRFGGRRADWPDVADRIDRALKTWRSLNAAQRSVVPLAVVLQRLERRISVLEAATLSPGNKSRKH
jgi:hypothetical protein